MELEKAILKLKAICKQCHNSKECWNNEFCSDCYIEVEDVLAIETVLRAYEELRKENEEIKKILSYEIEYRQKLEEDLYQSCSNYVVPKDKIKELRDISWTVVRKYALLLYKLDFMTEEDDDEYWE